MAKLTGAARRSDNAKLWRLEIAARADLARFPVTDEDAWLHLAHDAIVEGFCELTSDEAQRNLWQREG